MPSSRRSGRSYWDSQQSTVGRIDPACLRRGIERSMLEGHTEPGTISESGASDQWNVFRIDPPTRSGHIEGDGSRRDGRGK